jgi:hypothetical protein
MNEDQGLPIARAGFIRAAAVAAQTLALTGDHDTDAGALAKVLDGDAPGLVLDFVWGPVAETAFAALTRRGAEEDSADIKAQIPVYLELITSGSVQVPFRTFPLSDVSAAWTASAETGPRVVLIRD